jgi:hypothetical protein
MRDRRTQGPVVIPIAGLHNIVARQSQSRHRRRFREYTVNGKQPGENWSVQFVAQHSESADDVDEGHTCDDECCSSAGRRRKTCVRFWLRWSDFRRRRGR